MDKTFLKGVGSISLLFEEIGCPSIRESLCEWIRFLPGR